MKQRLVPLKSGGDCERGLAKLRESVPCAHLQLGNLHYFTARHFADVALQWDFDVREKFSALKTTGV